MKRIALSLLVMTGIVVSASAQDSPSGMKKHHRHSDGMMTEKLNFSEDQKTQLKSINEDYRKQMEELKKKDDITVKEWNSRKQSLRNDHHDRINGLLTSDQKAQLEKMKADRMQKREANSKERMEKMKTRLGLSNDQVAQLNKNREDLREKLKSIHDNASIDENKKKEEMKEAMKQQREKMKTILSEEQLKKLKEGQKDKSKEKDRL